MEKTFTETFESSLIKKLEAYNDTITDYLNEFYPEKDLMSIRPLLEMQTDLLNTIYHCIKDINERGILIMNRFGELVMNPSFSIKKEAISQYLKIIASIGIDLRSFFELKHLKHKAENADSDENDYINTLTD